MDHNSLELFKSYHVENILIEIMMNREAGSEVKLAAMKALLMLYSASSSVSTEQAKVGSFLCERDGIRNL